MTTLTKTIRQEIEVSFPDYRKRNDGAIAMIHSPESYTKIDANKNAINDVFHASNIFKHCIEALYSDEWQQATETEFFSALLDTRKKLDVFIESLLTIPDYENQKS